MRLIDADALKDEFIWFQSAICDCSQSEIQDVIQRIENAPTIDPESIPIVQELRKQLAKEPKQGKMLPWAVQEWRRKHKRCRWCQYYYPIPADEFPPFTVLITDGICAAKRKKVYCDIPRLFCEVFQVKGYKSFHNRILDAVDKR